MTSRNRRTSAFTLIELLVVIAIIAILAAILFPVFAQAREKARGAACLSNTKQMGLALVMYVQDYDEFLPYNYYYVQANGINRYHWSKMLTPYTKNDQIFACPSDTNPTPVGSGTVGGVVMYDYQAPKVSYIPNYAVLAVYSQPTIPISIIGSPASVIVFAEKINFLPTTPPKQIKTYAGVVGFDNPSAGVWTYMTYAEIMALLAAGSTADNLTRVDFTRHSGGSNYSFSDGHSKWYRLDQTIPGGPSEDLSTPVKTTDHRLWGEWNYSGSN